MKREESEKLSRSRRCMGRAAFYCVTGQPGRRNAAEIPESEDLPLHEYYTRLRSMIRCKDTGLMEGLFLHPAVKAVFLCEDARVISLNPRHACMAVEKRLIDPLKHEEKSGQGPAVSECFAEL